MSTTHAARTARRQAPAATIPPALAARLSTPAQPAPPGLLEVLRGFTVSLVRSAQPYISARQLGVFLTVYLQDGPHTVRGLAAELNVSKPVITRALDRLGELDLVRRKVDPTDRRSVHVQRTLKGAAFLRDIRASLTEAAERAA